MADEDCGCVETDITSTIGDSEDIAFQLVDKSTPPVAWDLSKARDGTANRPTIMRFAIKKKAKDPNSLALVYKTSYSDAEILYAAQAGATLGKGTVRVDHADTDDIKAGVYPWDLEATQQDFVRTSTGTVAFASGSVDVVGTGTAFASAKVGDVLHPTSGGSANKPVIITEILSATALKIDRAIYGTEAGITFEIRRGFVSTAAKGDWTFEEGVVT